VPCYSFRIVRPPILLVLCLAFSAAALGQTTATPQPTSSLKDPRAIFAAAAPLYDFSDPSLKPWDLKANYQLYDETGKPTEQGSFEYWWASPSVHRSTWSRLGATHTDWYTSDGKHAYSSSGEGLNYFEIKLSSAFLSPLPDAAELNSSENRLERQDVKVGNEKLPCLMVVPKMPQHGRTQEIPLGLFPTYCFDPNVPALRVSYSFGTMTEGFNSIAKVQGRYLPREVVIFEGKRELLSAKVESVAGLTPSDPEFSPDPQAKYPTVDKVPVSADVAVGRLIKKVQPNYPQDAKDANVSGTVVLKATIGTDGRIHELRVIEAPWPSLVASAMWAVSQWQYKPYLVKGEPVEVETTVNVIYQLGPRQ